MDLLIHISVMYIPRYLYLLRDAVCKWREVAEVEIRESNGNARLPSSAILLYIVCFIENATTTRNLYEHLCCKVQLVNSLYLLQIIKPQSRRPDPSPITHNVYRQHCAAVGSPEYHLKHSCPGHRRVPEEREYCPTSSASQYAMPSLFCNIGITKLLTI